MLPILAVCCLLLTAGTVGAEDAVQIEISLLQKLTEDSEAVTVATDTLTVPHDLTVTARIGNVVFDLAVLSHSEETATLRIEMITSGPSSKRAFRTYNVPFGLPAIVDSVIVKRKSFYRASLKPLGMVESEIDCEHDSADSTAFTSDPAPHFQMYFVPQSLGDYHWNTLRGYLELEYKELDKFYRFDDPQPVNLYLMPCYAPSMHYDSHHGFMIDPVKNNVMAVYNHEEKAAVSLGANMMKFYKFWGYAPQFFVEGVASFADFNDYYVQEYMKNDATLNARDYFVSDAYAGHEDRSMSRRVAGSFCSYLVESYDISKFKRFYEISTDLTASSDLEEVYGRSTDSLITDWHYYIDTLSINPGLFRYHSQRISYMREYNEAVDLLEERLRRTGGSHTQAIDLANYYYRLGEYEDALEFFGIPLAGDSVEVRDIITYANMLLINGLLDSASVMYEKTILQDSMQAMAYYKIGRIQQHLGDLASAIDYFRKANDLSKEDQIAIDAHLAIGQCLRQLGDADSSTVYLASALNGAKLHLMGEDPNPPAALRAGEAFVYLGQPEPAIEHLGFAYFVEERPFYIGRIMLAMGNAYDLMGERETALEYYGLVKDAPGAYLHSKAADRYIEQPFTLNR
jgi:tetratricopeptide (TPR) repeat protein